MILTVYVYMGYLVWMDMDCIDGMVVDIRMKDNGWMEIDMG
jgi:hypothetical protein